MYRYCFPNQGMSFCWHVSTVVDFSSSEEGKAWPGDTGRRQACGGESADEKLEIIPVADVLVRDIVLENAVNS